MPGNRLRDQYRPVCASAKPKVGKTPRTGRMLMMIAPIAVLQPNGKFCRKAGKPTSAEARVSRRRMHDGYANSNSSDSSRRGALANNGQQGLGGIK